MKKLSPKAVIFDLGSTLVNFPVSNWDEVSRECSLAGRQHLIEAGHDLPSEAIFLAEFEKARANFRELAADTYKEWTIDQAAEVLLKDLGLQTGNGLAMKFFDTFYSSLERHLSLYDDTIDVLTRIRKRYEKVGLISNTIFPEKVHHHEFKRFGLRPYFDFAIFSSTFGLRKPHPSIFLEAARLAGCAPSDCVYIGDRYVEDFQGSTGAGMEAILKVFPDREYPENLPDTIRKIYCLTDLSKHLDI